MDAWREELSRLYALKVSGPEIQRMLQAVPMPATRPSYSQIRFDAVGNLWVEVGPSDSEPGAALEHLVFDEAGSFLGTVLLPPLRVLEIGSDYVLGVHRDELEVEYLQLFDLQKTTTPAGGI
jgi:hypothetical protein